MALSLADSSAGEAGLAEGQAAERLLEDGLNELPAARRRGWLVLLVDVVREPMLALLFVCGAVYVALGDKGEAAMLLGFVLVIVAIGLAQAQRAERTLDELREISASRATVTRDGIARQIPARELVQGDLVTIVEGDRIPADCVLLTNSHISVDESLLTGESATVRKIAARDVPSVMGRPGGEDTPFLFSGTMVVAGKGAATVVGTGRRTQIGIIGKALSGIKPELARVQLETMRLVRRLALAGAFLSLLVAAWYGLSRGSWLQAILVGIALAMAILPEELPVVLSAYMALGAWRIAQKGVLTRHLPAIETLGSATVICVDKTGTLTENRMSVGAIAGTNGETWFDQASKLIPDSLHEVLEYGVLASHRDPFDPTERAIADALTDFLAGTEHVHVDWTLAGDYPLSRAILAMSRAWRSRELDEYIIAAKGAPEAIADLCHMPADAAAQLQLAVGQLASQGLRVLGVARSRYPAKTLPSNQHDFPFTFLGLIGLHDPVRESVPAAVREAQTAGIRIIMITGDYPATATSIATEIGLADADRYVTGPQLDAMSDDELARIIRTTSIFCRVVPEQKLRLVSALKHDGEIVAMTGDGVNDAPALRAANVGIAMGKRGTDVAREAASLLLLHDDFGSIIGAIKQGRRIFDNLHKAISFVVAAHVPIIGMSVIPVAFGMPLLLLPIHILFLQLIIDPACSIAFEAEPAAPDIMRRPPRDPDERLFSSGLVWTAVIEGCVILATVVGVFIFALSQGSSEGSARAMAFTSMVLSSLALLFINRFTPSAHGQRRPNAAMVVISTGSIGLLVLALTIAPLQRLFNFGPITVRDGVALLVGWLISLTMLLAVRPLTKLVRIHSAGNTPA